MPVDNAPQIADPLVRAWHIQAAVGKSESSIAYAIRLGRLPAPAHDGPLRSKLWKLSEIRSVNPTLADSIEILQKLPIVASL